MSCTKICNFKLTLKIIHHNHNSFCLLHTRVYEGMMSEHVKQYWEQVHVSKKKSFFIIFIYYYKNVVINNTINDTITVDIDFIPWFPLLLCDGNSTTSHPHLSASCAAIVHTPSVPKSPIQLGQRSSNVWQVDSPSAAFNGRHLPNCYRGLSLASAPRTIKSGRPLS